MQRFGLLFSQSWYQQASPWQKELIRTAIELYGREERLNSSFQDYSFLVFPIAKAYEGFLKDFFLQSGMITEEIYRDKRFRIGRAINPDVHPARRDDFWIYQQIETSCGKPMARMMWETWLTCRNQIFHYFPENQKRLSLYEAGKYIELVAQTMEQSFACQLQTST